MRILMVNARLTPFGGAIAQYTDGLCEALGEIADLEIDRLQLADWGRRAWPEARKALRLSSPDLVHIQYPMTAYGHSVVPHLMALRWRSAVTLHEASALGAVRAIAALGPLLARAPLVLVSSDFERRWLARRLPLAASRLRVVAVGNSVGVAPTGQRVPDRVVTFGTLRPWRGLETVLDFAELVRDHGLPWEVRVVGASTPDQARFAGELHQRGENLGVRFTGALPADEVAKELAAATVGYFPFPDGASERHSSLIAALANGLPVVATVGERTPPELAEVVYPSTSPASALTAVAELLADAGKRSSLSEAGRHYAERCSWPAIAARHRELYGQVVAD